MVRPGSGRGRREAGCWQQPDPCLTRSHLDPSVASFQLVYNYLCSFEVTGRTLLKQVPSR